jgi:cell division protease FtsH
LTKEVLFQSDVETLIGKRPYEEKKLLDAVEDEDGKLSEIGEISAGVPPYDSDITNKSLP